MTSHAEGAPQAGREMQDRRIIAVAEPHEHERAPLPAALGAHTSARRPSGHEHHRAIGGAQRPARRHSPTSGSSATVVPPVPRTIRRASSSRAWFKIASCGSPPHYLKGRIGRRRALASLRARTRAGDSCRNWICSASKNREARSPPRRSGSHGRGRRRTPRDGPSPRPRRARPSASGEKSVPHTMGLFTSTASIFIA